MNDTKTLIKSYLSRYGRSLERAIFDYHIEGTHNAHVFSELKRYQNRDGGFAKGLEPDFYTPESAPISTWSALNIMHAAGIESNHPMLVKTLEYLENTPYYKNGFYQTTIPSMNDYPGAPWWRYEKGKEVWGYNPTASLAGFILKYTSKDAPLKKRGLKIREDAIKAFKTTKPEDMHELRCFAELYELTHKDYPDEAFAELLKRQILKTVERDKNQWFSDYTARPSSLIVSKNTPGYEDLKELLKEELALTANKIQEKGFADITWEWGTHEEAYEKARLSWRGVLSVRHLIAENAFLKK